MEINEGDKITVKYDDTKEAELTVSGIYRNYVNNYVFVTDETYEKIFKKTYEPATSFVTFKDGVDEHAAMEKINNDDDVAAVSLNSDTRAYVDDMMKSLDFVVWLVIGCAAALAFIVMFNLSNINITEREREIATIEVLGFYPRETGSYVFRENFLLVLMGIVFGLPLGFVLHKFIMSRIIVDMVAFNNVIRPVSYLYGTLMVIAFAVFVDLIMRIKLRKINMAEALKSIE